MYDEDVKIARMLGKILPTLGPSEELSRTEVKDAIQNMKSNKADGTIGAVTEMMRALDEEGTKCLLTRRAKWCANG